jgi:hypothetical protein
MRARGLMKLIERKKRKRESGSGTCTLDAKSGNCMRLTKVEERDSADGESRVAPAHRSEGECDKSLLRAGII